MSNEEPLKGVSANELRQLGVKIGSSSDPASRKVDLLERYRSVPNHAMFLYTSEDSLVDNYIRSHWIALNGLSGDTCDIHVSLMQLKGDEDAYSQMEDVRTIPGLDKLDPTDLPALHIWSGNTSVRISLARFREESELKEILRLIFSELQKYGQPLSMPFASDLKQKVQSLRRIQFGGSDTEVDLLRNQVTSEALDTGARESVLRAIELYSKGSYTPAARILFPSIEAAANRMLRLAGENPTDQKAFPGLARKLAKLEERKMIPSDLSKAIDIAHGRNKVLHGEYEPTDQEYAYPLCVAGFIYLRRMLSEFEKLKLGATGGPV
jgi:hypothetical protein